MGWVIIATRRPPWSNPCGGEIFGTCPDRPWGPPIQNLLYKGYRVSFPEVKRSGRGFNYPSRVSAEGEERVEPYLCPLLYVSSGRF
jgi:hypothetical protein